MSMADDFIFGNPGLHHQFCVTTEILAALIAQAPHPVAMPALEKLTGHPARDLANLCSSLWQNMLITPNDDGRGWVLVIPAHRLTLEDVFRCVVESQKARPGRRNDTVRMRADVEIFLNQATIAINQTVFQHLRKYPLSRLRMDGGGQVGTNSHFLYPTGYDADSERAASSEAPDPETADPLIGPLTSPLS